MEQFADFIKKEYKNILNYIYKNLKHPDSEEFLQSGIVYFLEKEYYLKFDPNQSSLKTYFINFLKLKYKYYFKYQKNTLIVSLDETFTDSFGFFTDKHDIIGDEIEDIKDFFKIDILLNILDNLNLNRKADLKLFLSFINGKTYRDIAGENEMNLDTLKSKFERLRRYINKEYSRLSGENLKFTKKRKVNEKKRIKKVNI